MRRAEKSVKGSIHLRSRDTAQKSSPRRHDPLLPTRSHAEYFTRNLNNQ
jgi:hypothetical protein